MLRHFDSIHLVSTNGSSRLQRPRAYFCLLHIHTHIHTKGPMWSWYSSHVPITHTYQWTILLCTEHHILPTTHDHVTILIVVSPSEKRETVSKSFHFGFSEIWQAGSLDSLSKNRQHHGNQISADYRIYGRSSAPIQSIVTTHHTNY